MWEWFHSAISQMQGGIMRSLAAELRAGGMGAVIFAFGLGALHALTPGHGKAALAAYFLGREAHIGKGIRVALIAENGQALCCVMQKLCRVPGFPGFVVFSEIRGERFLTPRHAARR